MSSQSRGHVFWVGCIAKDGSCRHKIDKPQMIRPNTSRVWLQILVNFSLENPHGAFRVMSVCLLSLIATSAEHWSRYDGTNQAICYPLFFVGSIVYCIHYILYIYTHVSLNIHTCLFIFTFFAILVIYIYSWTIESQSDLRWVISLWDGYFIRQKGRECSCPCTTCPSNGREVFPCCQVLQLMPILSKFPPDNESWVVPAGVGSAILGA